MLVKFFHSGTGKTKSGESVRDYLLNDRVNEGSARVLRGNVNLTTRIINDISHFSKTYTAGCLSFEPGVFITHQQIDDVIDSFEQTLLPSLDRDQYQSYWVEHVDKGKLELNFVIANVELLTGNSLTPYYPPAQKKTVNVWKNLTNLALGLEDPEDPLYRRNFLKQAIHNKDDNEKQSNSKPKPNVASGSKSKKDVVEMLAEQIKTRVNQQLIRNRDDVIDFLHQQKFEVTDIKDDYLRIKNPDTTLYRGKPRRPIKLAGYYFEKDFDAAQSTPNAKEKLSQEWRHQQYKNLRKMQEFYRQSLIKRAARLQKRYKREDPNTDFEPILPPEPKFGPPPAPVVYDDPTDHHDIWLNERHFVLTASEIEDKLARWFDTDKKTVVKIRTSDAGFAKLLEHKAAQFDLPIKVAITDSLDTAELDTELAESEKRIAQIKATLHDQISLKAKGKPATQDSQLQTATSISLTHRTAKNLFRLKVNVLTKEDFMHAQQTGECNNLVSLDFAHQLVTNNDALGIYDIYYYKNFDEPNVVRSRALLNSHHTMPDKIWRIYTNALQGYNGVKVDQFVDDYCNMPVEEFCQQYQIPWREDQVELFERSHPLLNEIMPEALTISTAEFLELKFPVRVYKNKRFDKNIELYPDEYVQTVNRSRENTGALFTITYHDRLEEMAKRLSELLTKLLRMLVEFIFGNRHNSQMMQDTKSLNIVEFTSRYPMVSLTSDDINQQQASLAMSNPSESSVQPIDALVPAASSTNKPRLY